VNAWLKLQPTMTGRGAVRGDWPQSPL